MKSKNTDTYNPHQLIIDAGLARNNSKWGIFKSSEMPHRLNDLPELSQKQLTGAEWSSQQKVEQVIDGDHDLAYSKQEQGSQRWKPRS